MSKINIIDLNFLGTPNCIAAHIIETSDGPILIETGPHSTIQNLEKGIQDLGYQVTDIKHVFLTHIHLDHAGAAWYFAEKGANIYLHPFGVRHMADPSKFIASAKRIYKDDMDRLWGQINPIDKEKLIPVEHQQKITIGDTELIAWHTPGHAVHHIAWQIEKDLIAGDVAGVKIGDGIVVAPCPPPDINIEDWLASIHLIRELPVENLYLSHFGKVDNKTKQLDELENQLQNWADWMRPFAEEKSELADVKPLFDAYVRQQYKEYGLNAEQIIIYENANPSWMSVAGLMRYWKKKFERGDW